MEDIDEVVKELVLKAGRLEYNAKKLFCYHQIFTVSTILLGVIAPALVTFSFSAFAKEESVWQIIAIGITAFATVSATIRSVLRFSERYKNASLTALLLRDLETQLKIKQLEAEMEIRPELLNTKLKKYANWAREEMSKIQKTHVEREVEAISQDVKLIHPPKLEESEKK